MPNGRIHSASSVVVAISGATTMLLLGRGTEDIAGIAIGALVGVLLSPDADVNGGSIADYYIRRYSGIAVEVAWDSIWAVYRKVCKHRGFISHFPVISTVLRIAYLSAFYFLIATPLKYLSGLVRIDWPVFLWWAFIGLVLADMCHWALDKLDEKSGGRL